MEIKKSNISMWSLIGSRATFGLAAIELAKKIENMIVLTGDTSTSAGLQRFIKAYPDKFLDVGISEQNMIGIAAGLASEGEVVFTSTFSPFQTLRCCEQIKVNLGYMKHKVNMVGLASGVVLGALGYTHCSIEDMAIMRAIPGITVISPADCTETFKAVLAVVDYPQSVYIRLTGGTKNPPVYDEDYDFVIGKAMRIREGHDIAFIATGTMVYEAKVAAENLEKRGISAAVINMHTIKPVDTEMIMQTCKQFKLLVTVEEHCVTGGLGSAVSEFKSTLKNAPPLLMIGLPSEYGKSNLYEEMLIMHGLKGEFISEKVMAELDRLSSHI